MSEESKIKFETTPLDEQETVIDMDYVEKRAYVYTSRSGVAQKLKKMCETYPADAQVARLDKYGLEVSVPMDWITIRPKVKRSFTEEQKQAMRERLVLAREARDR